METARENQEGFQPENLAEGLDDFAQVCDFVAVLAHEAVESGDAEAIAVDFDGTSLEDVGDCGHFFIPENFGDGRGNGVVFVPRRELGAPGVEFCLCDLHFLANPNKEGSVIPNPNVVGGDEENADGEGPVGEGEFFVQGQEFCVWNEDVHRLEFADGADELDVEFADFNAPFARPIFFVVGEGEPCGGLVFPFCRVCDGRLHARNNYEF